MKRGLHKARFSALFTGHVSPFRDMTGLNEARFPALFTGHVSPFQDVIGLDEARFPTFFIGHVFPFRDMIGLEEARYPALSYVVCRRSNLLCDIVGLCFTTAPMIYNIKHHENRLNLFVL